MTVKMQAQFLDESLTEVVHLPSGDKITTDAPADHGGKGSHFSPTDLVAAALGTCAITRMAIVARHKGVKVEPKCMRAEIEKNMKATPRRIGPLNVVIYITGNYSDLEKQILEEAGNGCPVKESLKEDCDISLKYIYNN